MGKKEVVKIGEKHLENFRINSEDPIAYTNRGHRKKKQTQWQRNTFLNKAKFPEFKD